MGLCVCICVCFTWCINAGMITIFVIFNFHPFSICFEIQREKQFLTDKGQRPHHRHQGQFSHFSSILGDFFFLIIPKELQKLSSVITQTWEFFLPLSPPSHITISHPFLWKISLPTSVLCFLSTPTPLLFVTLS